MKSRAQRPFKNSLSTDALFEVLSHHRRRALLADLQAHDQPQAVADVVKRITVHEQDTPFDELPSEDIEQVHCSVHHVHIPKLEDSGLLTRDDDRNTVTLTEQANRRLPEIDPTA